MPKRSFTCIAVMLVFILALICAGFVYSEGHRDKKSGGPTMKLIHSTPILYVDRIEPNLSFWTERLGFKKTAEVPPGGSELDFVILEKDSLEVMLQTRHSLQGDLPKGMSIEEFRGNTTIQYMEVDSLAEVLKGLHGIPLAMEPIDRPYGMREILVRDPSGYLIEFAEKINK
jgi:catechol 2,3-dioxygenase-like lactoylglutathione lyase family enzyme